MHFNFAAEVNNNEDVQKFMEEANKMRKYSHPHLLSLEGISKIDGKYATISQLMTNGGLRQYLLKQADQVWF